MSRKDCLCWIALSVSGLCSAHAQSLPAVTVTTPVADDASQTGTSLSGAELDRRRAVSLGDTLDGQVGVNSSGFSTAAGRPVIRGQSGSRVTVSENGLDSLDASDISPDHAVTADPLAARRIADTLAGRGIKHLDAPVSGGPMGARDGTLSIMAGGSAVVFARVMPVLECMGKTILHMGDHGAGQVTKACNQLSLAVTLQGVAEAMNLAGRCGVDPVKVREAMMGGFAASRVLELFGKRMVERNFENGVDARFYHKDLNIVLSLMHELGLPAPATAVTLQQINALIGSGGGRSDFSRMIEVLERAGGAATEPKG